MARIETNIFPITNLSDLTSKYLLYRIKGLSPFQSEYYQNIQHIKHNLSYQLKSPITVIEREGSPYLVVRDDVKNLPDQYPLVRTVVAFEQASDILNLDYTKRSKENDEICLRFLQFIIQTPLYNKRNLWQPGAGKPYFFKRPEDSIGSIDRYLGFSLRVVVTNNGGMGVCVDISSKFISNTPLPKYITNNEFMNLKGRTCVYKFGHIWYEIKVASLSDLSVGEYLIPNGNSWNSLLEYISEKTSKPIPKEITDIPHDSSTIIYKDSRGNDRGAPAGLCYPTIRPWDNDTRIKHRSMQLPPHIRNRKIKQFVHNNLRTLRFGGIQIHISKTPISQAPQTFIVPDLVFGNNTLLSVRGTDNAVHTTLDDLGRDRLELLKNQKVGFYSNESLNRDRQYLILPQSVFDSFGTSFISDLQRSVSDIFGQNSNYNPNVVTYEDRVPRTYPAQGNSILAAVTEQCKDPGYGVVMIHHTIDQDERGEDQLAGMVMRETRKLGLSASIIHSNTPMDAYYLVDIDENKSEYRVKHSHRGILSGYLRNVAINKILLSNHRWPFILDTKLHSDLVIGIDVKYNTVGIVVVSNNGGEIRTLHKESSQKERLMKAQLKKLLKDIILEEAQSANYQIQNILISRDGRIYQSEIDAIKELSPEIRGIGMIADNAEITIIEIPKSSPAPLRLFDVSKKDGRQWIENPQVGNYYLASEFNGYLCNTGRAFPRRGTVNPLHIKKSLGPLSIKICLQDIFFLSSLAWSRPEDCTRYPITTKLNDRYLKEDATKYDIDTLEYSEIIADEVNNE